MDGVDTEKEVNNVIAELHSGRGSKLYGALIMLRTTLIKSRSSLNHLIELGAVKLLIGLLEQHQRHVNATKTIDIVMSILANMCMEEDVRQKIADCDGICVIAHVTMASEQESIQNRGVRALANLSQDADKVEKIVGLEVPDFVAKRLMETEDEECRSTFCRALHLFAQTSKGVDKLVEDTQTVQALAALLKLDNRKLALKSLRTLSELCGTRSCSAFSGQILAASILEELVTFADDEDSTFASFSLTIILRLCEQELMRPALGSAGVVSLLTKLLKSSRVFVNKVATLNALCLCTKEAVNRKKIHDAGGLELLMAALENDSQSRFSVLHDRIISSLINFLYNEDCLARLLELGLVKLLIQHLQRCCFFSCADWDWKKEMGTLVCGNQSDRINTTGSSETEDQSCCAENARHDLLKIGDNAASGDTESSPVDHMAVSENRGNEHSDSMPSSTEIIMSKLDQDTCIISQDVDPLIIDTSKATDDKGMVVDISFTTRKPENSPFLENSDELPAPPTTSSRHTYSINSPTYQAETSWKLEDYISGATCKDFSQEQEMVRMTPPYPHSAAMSDNGFQSPYSPLSAGASYYSPAQSSPACNASLSPLRSVSPYSPASSARISVGSPAWLLTNPEQQSPHDTNNAYDTPHQSHLSPAFHGQFSPLSNIFPASPLQSFEENEPQSPLIPSQVTRSPCSQNASPFERYQASPRNTRSSDLSDQLVLPRQSVNVVPKFIVVPLSQDSATVGIPVYSASEDEDDNEEESNECESQPQQDLQVCAETELSDVVEGKCMSSPEKQTPQDCDRPAESAIKQLDFGRQKIPTDNSNVSQNIGTENSLRKASLIPQQKRSAVADKYSSLQFPLVCQQERSPKKRRRLSNDPLFDGNHHQIHNVEELCGKDVSAFPVMETESSCHSYHSPQISAEKEKTGISHEQCKTDSSFECPVSINMRVTTETPGVPGLEIDEAQQNPEKPLLFTLTQPKSFSSSQVAKCGTLKRMSSYPAAGKQEDNLPTGLKKHMSGSVSSSPRDRFSLLSPRLGASPLISDSPYQSPYPEHMPSPRLDHVADQGKPNDRKISAIKMKVKPWVSIRSHAHTTENGTSKVDETHDSPISDTARSSVSARTTTTPNTQTSHIASDVRIQKILRATESNILILLARVSVKTNPSKFLAEASVMSSLLGYMASALNPIRRCCRVVYRVCSNPLCFDKLILSPVPALFVRSLILDEDGSFPRTVFPVEGENRVMNDLLPSSQSSEGSGSQASEFGRKMDFEFGGDAYSRMASQRQTSIGALFREGPSLSIDSQSARDAPHGAGDIYDIGVSRKETRVRIGLELLRTMAVVAMTPYGEGEIQHILSRCTQQDKLACAISLLHLRVGWGHFSRRQLPLKYKLWDQLLPCLFIPEALHARETIVTGISLNIHLDKPPKQVKEILTLLSCSDFVSCKTGEVSSKGDNPSAVQSSFQCKDKGEMYEYKSGMHYKLHIKEGEKDFNNRESDGDMSDKLPTDGEDEEMDFDSDGDRKCPYKYVSYRHDLHFILHEGETTYRLGACRKLLVQKSEVFAAMLSGAYVESNKSEIEISDMNKDSFEFIIHYLHGCVTGCPVIDCLNLTKSESSNQRANSPLPDKACCGIRISEDVQKETSGYSLQLLDVSSRHQVVEIDIADAVDSTSTELETKPEGFIFATGVKDVKENTLNNLSDSCQVKKAGDFLHSEDSLDSLILEDKSDSKLKTHNAASKIDIQTFPGIVERSDMGAEHEGETETGSKEENENKELQRIEMLLNKCADILALADRFLLSDLTAYPTSVLSHICLCPYTAEEIFRLACFYKLDPLAVDCVREILLSSLPSQEMAAVLLDLAQEGHREHVQKALLSLLNALTV